MATFRALVQGSRGSASRPGHKNISAIVNGWNIGVKVYGYRNDDGSVEFHVYQTGGSKGATSDKKIKVVREPKK